MKKLCKCFLAALLSVTTLLSGIPVYAAEDGGEESGQTLYVQEYNAVSSQDEDQCWYPDENGVIEVPLSDRAYNETDGTFGIRIKGDPEPDLAVNTMDLDFSAISADYENQTSVDEGVVILQQTVKQALDEKVASDGSADVPVTYSTDDGEVLASVTVRFTNSHDNGETAETETAGETEAAEEAAVQAGTSDVLSAESAASDGQQVTAETTASVTEMVQEWRESIETYYTNNPPVFEYGTSGEWDIIGMLRAGMEISQEDREAYLADLVAEAADEYGDFWEYGKPTDYERTSLTLFAMGEDPTKVDRGDGTTIDLIDYILNTELITDGVNEAEWALIALDSVGVEIPEGSMWTRETLVAEVLSYQNEDGGFPLTKGAESDVDLTAMALQSLARYQDQEDVKAATEKALAYLIANLDDQCDYGSVESNAQTVVALLMLGIDPSDPDSGFTKGEADLFTAIDQYKAEGGGFKHIKDGSANHMATQQTLLAVASWQRYAAGENDIYNMADVSAEEPADPEQIVEEWKESIETYYTNHPLIFEYENEFDIIGMLRSGKEISQEDREAYLKSLAEEAADEYGDLWDGGIPIDFARTALALYAMGEDPSKVDIGDGKTMDLIQYLLNSDRVSDLNVAIWSLIALDSVGVEIPEGSRLQRDALVELVLSCQNEDGGFALKGAGSDEYWTALALQALARYQDQEDVKTATEKALAYLKGKLNEQCDYGTTESNAETVTALLMLGIDPTDPDNGFTKGDADLFTAIDAYKGAEGGFKHVIEANIPGQESKVNQGATRSVLLAAASWLRYQAGENDIYDMTDVFTEEPDNPNEKTVVVAVEKFTIGQGYLVEPTEVTVSKELDTSEILTQVLETAGLDFRNDGQIGSDTYYLSMIIDTEGDKTAAFPQIITRYASDNNVRVTNPRRSPALGEFDYTRESGWKYTVNNYMPPVGLGAWVPEDGDVIRVHFTAIAYGGDIGVEEVNYPVFVPGVNADAMTKLLAQVNSAENKDELLGCENVKAAYDAAVEAVSNIENTQETVDAAAASLEYALAHPGDAGEIPESVQRVIDQIDEIGTVSLEKEAAIAEARTAYNALAAEQQGAVTNYAVLTAAESKLANLKAADPVTKQIKALPSVENLTLGDQEKVEAARTAYTELSYSARILVSDEDLETLAALEEKIEALKDAAAEVEEEINALPAADELTLENAEAVDTVQSHYNALDDAQKALISADAKAKLEAAAEKIEALRTEAADKAEAQKVIDLIGGIGDVTLDSEDAIQAARTAYDKLTEIQKSYVTNYTVLTAAEAKLAELKEQAADKAAAQNVIDLIFAIGDVNLDSGEKIEAARDAYDKLTETQKGYVTNYTDLTAAETKLADLKAMDAVETKIEALPSVEELTLADREAVEEARNAYTGLTEEQKAMVSEKALETLADLEKRIAELTDDKDAAERVEQEISSLPAVENLTLDDAGAVDMAQAHYDALTEAQKTLVSAEAKDKLDAAAEKIAELRTEAADKAAAQTVIDLIDEIGEVTLESRDEIEAARAAYNELSEKQQGYVTNYEILTAAESRLEELQQAADQAAADAVTEQIEALPATEELTLENAAAVDAAQAAYDALTDEQKALIPEDVTARLQAAAEQIEGFRNQAAADTAEDLINSIGEVTLEKKEAIEAAREAYDALTEAQKELVTNLDVLEEAEAELAALEEQEKGATLIDETYHISVYGENLTEDMTLRAEPLKAEDNEVVTMCKEIPSTQGLTKLYRLVILQDGGEITPDGPFTVTFNMGAAYEGQEMTVLLLGADNKINRLSGTVEDGSLSFDTDSLGCFGVVVALSSGSGGSGTGNGNGSGKVTADVTGTGNVQTGDDTTALPYIAGLGISALIILAAVSIKRKKHS